MNEYKGFSLFNDIEDVDLRNRNRAVILGNILEQNTRDSKITPRGAALILGYFSAIPDFDKKPVEGLFRTRAKELGYAV